jgi:outer membrane autotransporter protein
MGASFAYTYTSINGKGDGNAQTNLNSYQFSLYSDYTSKRFYLESMVGYARSANSTVRELTFGGLNRQAKGAYGANQYMASIGGGMTITLGPQTWLTPRVGLTYAHYAADAYTEEGAGNLNLRVGSDAVSVLQASIGARVETRIRGDGASLIPFASVDLNYDLLGQESRVSGEFIGGGGVFTVNGADVPQLGGRFGFGLTYNSHLWSVGGSSRALRFSCNDGAPLKKTLRTN